MIDSSLTNVIVGLLGGGGLLGGLYALLKLRPEAGQITVTAAQGAVIVQTGVIENLKKEIGRLADHLAEVEMEGASREVELENCTRTITNLNQQIQDFQLTVKYLQKDLDRHAKIADIARRKAHVAINAITGYELLIDELSDELRKHLVPISPLLRPHKLRAALHEEMQKLEELEAQFLEQTIISEGE